jgi:hypothetical protein
MARATAGFLSFTEITDPAEHRSYNEWHQLDHLPEQYRLPGIVHGQRWAATPACRAARAVAEPRADHRLDRVHYLTLYVMAEPIDETLRDFHELGRRLQREGRFHQHRRALLSGPFDLETVRAAGRVAVSDEAILYRPNRGVYVIVESPATAADVAREATRRARLLEVAGVAGVASFTSRPPGDLPWRPGDHRITVCYLDADPVEAAPRVEAALQLDWGPLLAGPFETVIPWQWDGFDR